MKTSGEAAHETPQISPLAKQCITCLLSRLTTLHNAPPEESETKPEGETLPKVDTFRRKTIYRCADDTYNISSTIIQLINVRLIVFLQQNLNVGNVIFLDQ